METDKKWLTIREAANYIAMSIGFLRKAVRLCEVPHTRIGSKALRFDRAALDDWLAAQSSGKTCWSEAGENALTRRD